MTQAYLLAVSEDIGDLLRYALWMTVAGLVAVGACLCGGYGLYIAWAKTGPPARSRRLAEEAAVIRESSRGTAEIEAFLAARSSRGGPEPRPPGAGAT